MIKGREGKEGRGRKGRGGEEREGWDGVNPPKTNPGYGPDLDSQVPKGTTPITTNTLQPSYLWPI
jgi:hypothetical protein